MSTRKEKVYVGYNHVYLTQPNSYTKGAGRWSGRNDLLQSLGDGVAPANLSLTIYEVRGTQDVYVGGEITQAIQSDGTSVPINFIAHFNPLTGWDDMNGGPPINFTTDANDNGISAIEYDYTRNLLYVATTFASDNVATWDGSDWSVLPDPPYTWTGSSNGRFPSMTPDEQGNIYYAPEDKTLFRYNIATSDWTTLVATDSGLISKKIREIEYHTDTGNVFYMTTNSVGYWNTTTSEAVDLPAMPAGINANFDISFDNNGQLWIGGFNATNTINRLVQYQTSDLNPTSTDGVWVGFTNLQVRGMDIDWDNNIHIVTTSNYYIGVEPYDTSDWYLYSTDLNLPTGRIRGKAAPPLYTLSTDHFTYEKNQQIEIIASDYNGDINDWSIEPTLPVGLALSDQDGTITGSTNLIGSDVYTYRGAGRPREITIEITPLQPNFVYATDSYIFDLGDVVSIVASDINNNVSDWAVNPALPTGLALSDNGTIGGFANLISSDTYTITSTGATGNVERELTINIEPLPANFVLPSDTFSYSFGDLVEIVASDINNNISDWVINPVLPDGLSLSDNGVIAGTAGLNSSDVYTLTGTTMNSSLDRELTIGIYTTPPNFVYATDSYNITRGDLVTIQASDINGNINTWSVSPVLPSDLLLSDNGTIAGIISVLSSDSYTITGSSNTSDLEQTIAINVADMAINYVADSYSYVLGFFVSDGPTLTGSFANNFTIDPALPSDISFSQSDARFIGTPQAVSSDTTYTVTGYSINSSDIIKTTTFSLEITDEPVFEFVINEVTIQVGAEVLITPITSSNITGFSITPDLPDGLVLNTETGVISGSISAAFPSTTYTVIATLQHGANTRSAMVTAEITLNGVGNAPCFGAETMVKVQDKGYIPITKIKPGDKIYGRVNQEPEIVKFVKSFYTKHPVYQIPKDYFYPNIPFQPLVVTGDHKIAPDGIRYDRVKNLVPRDLIINWNQPVYSIRLTKKHGKCRVNGLFANTWPGPKAKNKMFAASKKKFSSNP